LKARYRANLDVRTSAHRPFRLGTDSLCLLCFGFHQKPKAVQTVKLTLHHRAETLRARYTDVDPSNWTKPPAYLFRNQQFQRAERQKSTDCASCFKRCPPHGVSVFCTSRCVCISASAPSGVPLAPQRRR